MIEVNSNYNFLVAVVTVNEEKLKQYMEVNGYYDDRESFEKSKDLEYGILKQFERCAI